MLQHYSYIYSVPYLVYFFFLLLTMLKEFVYLNKRQEKKKLDLLVLGSLIVFFGLRGFVYTDWTLYYQFFLKLPILADWDYWTLDGIVFDCGYEKGFILYSILIKSLFSNYFIWVFIGSLLDLIVIHKIITKNTNYYILAVIMFILFGGLTIEFNLYRNSKAIICFLLSINYLQKRKLIPYLLLNALGCYFHISALLYLPLYFILDRRINMKLIWTLFIIGNVIYLFQIPYLSKILLSVGSILGGRINALIYFYMADSHFGVSAGITIGYIERAISFILLALYYQKSRNSFTQVYVNMFFIYVFIYLYCSEFSIITQRVPLLFVLSYTIIYPQIFACFTSLKTKRYFLVVFVLYSVLKLAESNNEIFSRYDNLLFGIEKYEEREKILKQFIDKSE